MTNPYVIAINAVSGGGKTSLAKLVHESLPNSALFCFDDFDPTNVYPKDFVEWYHRGANLMEFDCPGMAAAVKEEISRGNKQYIILDYPFGRDHKRFSGLIDLSVFIDVPPDVAMARRTLRDYPLTSDVPAEERLKELRGEMAHYLEKARIVYADHSKHKHSCDLVLDGCNSLEIMRDKILAAIQPAREDIEVARRSARTISV